MLNDIYYHLKNIFLLKAKEAKRAKCLKTKSRENDKHDQWIVDTKVENIKIKTKTKIWFNE